MSSSMRNAVHRRTHRERAQPLERQRLGLLEKHKDYSLRAKDYNKKKATLKSLREKAANRNEDEFYFGMMSRKGPGSSLTRGRKVFDGTVANDRGNKALDMETVRLLKTQDVGYLRTMRNIVRKEVAELEERWVLAGGAKMEEEDDEDSEDERPRKKAKKIVFAEDEAKREELLERDMDIDEEEEGDDFADFDDEDDERVDEAERKAKQLDKLRKKLLMARKKLRALDNAERELDLQRAKMAKTATYGGVTKSGKKIRIRERKK
jgi:U3 small nucleolar RNA-associated protein 11